MKSAKATENHEKNVLQEFVQSSPRSKYFFLESRCDVMPWLSCYESIRATVKKSRVQDWIIQLLNIARESLRNEVDQQATRYMGSLKEFEKYIESTYITGLSLIDDLLSDILKNLLPRLQMRAFQTFRNAFCV